MVFQMKFILISVLLLGLNQAKAQTHSKILDDALNDIFLSKYASVEIDSVLQEQDKDTIQKVKLIVNGYWHFQGVKRGRYENDLVDTLEWSSNSLGSTTTFVKNGDVFNLNNERITKTDSIVFSHFDFSNSSSLVDFRELYKRGNHETFYSTRLCGPYYEIVYFQKEIGLLSKGMGGQSFTPIRYLSNKVLMFKGEEGLECHLKIE